MCWRRKGHIKKGMAILLSGLMIAGQIAIQGALGQKEVQAAPFTMGSDNHWAEPYMRVLYNEGIMRGDLQGNMNPDRKITRAEFVSIVNRAFGYGKTGRNPFKDVKGSEWYARDLNVAFNQGYFSGSAKGLAEPKSNLTREQAVALLCRNLKLNGFEGETFNFQDSRTFQSWSRGAINAATQKNIVAGYRDGTFRPSNSITRGEAAKIISTAIGKRVDTQGVTSLGYVDGNVTICASGATLRDTVIMGDLYITPGVGLGYTRLDNVKVLGEVIVCGAGESNEGKSSIELVDCNIVDLTMDSGTGKSIALKIDGSTEVHHTTVKSNTYLEELTNRKGGFREVELDGPKDTQLHLLGSFDKVTVKGEENQLYLDEGEVYELVMDEMAEGSTVRMDEDTYADRVYLDVGTTITGKGEIGYVKVNAEDVDIEGLPDDIEIRPGTTARINGRVMTSKDAEEASAYPKIMNKYPDFEEIGPNKVTALFETNKEGTLYWAVSLEDDGPANYEELLKPKSVKAILSSGKIDVTEAKEEFETAVSGLKPDTDYVMSAILVDERGDESDRKSEDFKTSDNTDPKFLSGYPKVITATNTSVELGVNMTKDCSVYWVAYPKGSVAPTEEEMRSEKYSGEVDHGKERSCEKNVMSTFHVNHLKEETDYDAYFLATDGTNYSKVTKLSFSTLDKTPPIFLEGYPNMGKVTDRNVEVRYSINENGSVYYVVFKRGTVFPAPMQGSTVPPGLDSDQAKKAVVTGNNALKSGKSSAKANDEGKLTVSGLEPETAYDLYMVGEDKSGNISTVQKLYIKTADNIPPTAKLEFEDVIDGNPLVESDIRIVFSEEVWDAITMKPITPEILVNNLNLYDMSASKRTQVPLDYTKMKVVVEDGFTTIVLPQAATNLHSGNKYEFELDHIIDTSNNKMKARTVLPQFQTVAPLVEVAKTVAPENLDMTFELNPQATNTADQVLFDMLLLSDSTVKFELYQKNRSTGKFELITGKYGEEPEDGEDPVYVPFVLEGEGLSLHYMLDRKMQGEKDFIFEPFNQMTTREYGIRFVEVDGNAQRESWSKTVTFNIKCVIGSKTNLSIAAGDPVDGLPSAVKEGAIVVNYPNPLEMMVTFVDTVIPHFMDGYPKLHNPNLDGPEPNKVGDTLILPLIRTTKEGTLYYLIAPKGTVEDNPTGLDIMTGALRPQNSVRGKYEVESANVEYEIAIHGLQPEVEYDAYFCLKGTPPEPSDVTHITFKTKDISPPVMYPVVVSSKGVSSASVSITVDKTAEIDWIVYPSVNNGGPNLKQMEADGNGALAIQYIRDGYEDPQGVFKPIGYGRTVVTVPVGKENATTVVECTGLSRNIYYNFYAVAKSPLGGKDSIISAVERVTPADVTPPTVEIASDINSADGLTYKGILVLRFSEPLYYIESEDAPMKPLTLVDFMKNLRKFNMEIDSVSDGDETIDKATLATYQVASSQGTSDGALTLVAINFSKAQIGEALIFPYEICDKNRNVAGELHLSFIEDYNDKNELRPKWVASFVRRT